MEKGSITFILPELSDSITLGATDQLELPVQVLHSAKVGAQAVVCLEDHIQ